jgi:hypothetical protein
VVVQKLRWGRNKDLDDGRDILAVQGPETLDMPYKENWCASHRTTERLLLDLLESSLSPSREPLMRMFDP